MGRGLIATLEGRKRRLLKKQHKTQSNKKVLRPKKGHHTDKPVYMSGSYTEYQIKQGEDALFFIKRYKGGKLNKKITGKWRNHSEAEFVLIQFLEGTDVRRQSLYPGSPKRRLTNYVKEHLSDFIGSHYG
jgi:hypothetical protein